MEPHHANEPGLMLHSVIKTHPASQQLIVVS